jgi:hypothetical protein
MKYMTVSEVAKYLRTNHTTVCRHDDDLQPEITHSPTGRASRRYRSDIVESFRESGLPHRRGGRPASHNTRTGHIGCASENDVQDFFRCIDLGIRQRNPAGRDVPRDDEGQP